MQFLSVEAVGCGGGWLHGTCRHGGVEVQVLGVEEDDQKGTC